MHCSRWGRMPPPGTPPPTRHCHGSISGSWGDSHLWSLLSVASFLLKCVVPRVCPNGTYDLWGGASKPRTACRLGPSHPLLALPIAGLLLGCPTAAPPPPRGQVVQGPQKAQLPMAHPPSLSMWHQGMLFPKALGPRARSAWTSFSWWLSSDYPAGLYTPGLPSVQGEGGLNPNFFISTQTVCGL